MLIRSNTMPKTVVKRRKKCSLLALDESKEFGKLWVFKAAPKKEKKGKQLLSHRYNSLPLLRSHPGGVQEELVVKDLPRHKCSNLI
jgi:hypothetical protein